MTRWRFWVRQHLPHSQLLYRQNLLWFFILDITPWFRQREHLGLLDLSIHCLLIVFSVIYCLLDNLHMRKGGGGAGVGQGYRGIPFCNSK